MTLQIDVVLVEYFTCFFFYCECPTDRVFARYTSTCTFPFEHNNDPYFPPFPRVCSSDIIENPSIEEEEFFSVNTARRSVSSPLHGSVNNNYDGYSRYQRRHTVTDVPSSRASPLPGETRTLHGRTLDTMKEINEDSGTCIHPWKIPLKKQSNFWLRKGCDTGAGSTAPRESSTGNDTWSVGGKAKGCYDCDETPPTSGLGSSGRSSSRSSGSQRTPRRYLVEQNRYRQGW